MKVLGLTGGIAMGKSTVAAQFELFGVKTICADRIVHHLLENDSEIISYISIRHPGVVHHGVINRDELGKQVFADPEKLLALEALLHPAVKREELWFIHTQNMLGAEVVLLDIPLLFETGAEDRCEYVITVSCPKFIQRQRALSRASMTEVKLKAILSHQLSDDDRRRKADAIVATGLGKAYSMQQVKLIMENLREMT